MRRKGVSGYTNFLCRNNGGGDLYRCSEKTGILKPSPRYSITGVSYDFRA
jgi:hypothetical protein